jgi:hypothetical protein
MLYHAQYNLVGLGIGKGVDINLEGESGKRVEVDCWRSDVEISR